MGEEHQRDGKRERRTKTGSHRHADRRGHEVGGLTVATDDLVLSPSKTVLEPGTERPWSFEILDERGEVRTTFDENHEALGHLIVVRRDLARFQHLHPEVDAEGTWSTRLTLPEPGVYRAFVDVSVDGRPATLGTDLFAPGPMDVRQQPETETGAVSGEYTVELRSRDFTPGEPADLAFDVRREGEPVVNFEPYLGARGHLVALREGDLAYLHVHPVEGAADDGIVSFRTRFPSIGRYRLFLQIRPEGNLLTVPFDVRVARDSSSG